MVRYRCSCDLPTRAAFGAILHRAAVLRTRAERRAGRSTTNDEVHSLGFPAECHHSDAAALPQIVRDRARSSVAQRSAGTADVPMPGDLEWPRRAIVGAIVVIGVARLATFSGCSVKSQTIALSAIDRQTPDYRSSIQSAKLSRHKCACKQASAKGGWQWRKCDVCVR